MLIISIDVKSIYLRRNGKLSNFPRCVWHDIFVNAVDGITLWKWHNGELAYNNKSNSIIKYNFNKDDIKMDVSWKY